MRWILTRLPGDRYLLAPDREIPMAAWDQAKEAWKEWFDMYEPGLRHPLFMGNPIEFIDKGAPTLEDRVKRLEEMLS